MCVCARRSSVSGLKDSQAPPFAFAPCSCSSFFKQRVHLVADGGVASSVRRQEKMGTFSRHFHIKSMCEGCRNRLRLAKKHTPFIVTPLFYYSDSSSAPAFFFWWGGVCAYSRHKHAFRPATAVAGGALFVAFFHIPVDAAFSARNPRGVPAHLAPSTDESLAG